MCSPTQRKEVATFSANLMHPLHQLLVQQHPARLQSENAHISRSKMKRKLIEILKAQAKRLQEAGVALGQGCSTYWDEAAWLALRALNRPIDESLDAIDVDDADVSTVEAVFEKRIQRTPAAYVLGEAWLQGERFFVDRRVVIPRSLISEVLVEYTESGLFKTERISTALDMCTGCGALAILMTKYFARLQRVDASDISADALDVARINVQQHRLTDRVRLVQSDLFAAVQRQYDLIVCNPPYVNDKSMQKLPEEYKKEPSIALAGNGAYVCYR
jgi:ribosomal protein L3 glutamine methyltransferase